MAAEDNLNPSQFANLYHGTRAALAPGDYVQGGHQSNYPELDEDPDREGKVWATPVKANARKFARQAQGPGKQRVYQVEPTGPVEWDEEADPEDFRSNRDMNRRASRRSGSPFKVVGEV